MASKTMESSWVSYSNIWSFRISVNQSYQNDEENYSTCEVQLQALYKLSYGSNMNIDGTYTLNVDGSEWNNKISVPSIWCEQNTVVTLATARQNIYHNSDGTKTFTVTAGASMTGQGVVQPFSASFTLDPIPKMSTISSITGGTIGGSMTVYLNKPTSSSTTSVWVALGSSGWVNVASYQSGSSISFTVPNSLANQIPNSTKGTGSVIIRTHNNGKDLGDHSWNKEFSVPDWMKYSITSITKDTDTQINGEWKFIKSKSKLKVTINTDNTNAYGATIKEYRFTFNGSTYYGNGTWTNIINTSGSKTISVTVTDSRGRTTTSSSTITIYDYSPPWGSISAYRCNSSGTRDDVNGTYVKVTFSGGMSSVDGANTFMLNISHRESDKEWSSDYSTTSTVNDATRILGTSTSSYDIDKTYEIKLKISDWYQTNEYIAFVSTSVVPLDYRAGGTGIGIGRYCTLDDTVQINKEIQMHNKSIVYEGVSDESQRVAWVPGTNSNMLSLTRLTTSSSGSRQTFMEIDKSNDCYNQCRNNYFANNIFFRNNSLSSLTYAEIRYQNSQSYYYAQSPDTNGDIGYWHDVDGAIWYYSASSRQLFLKAGYGTASDRRLKHDFNEFNNWDNYYNFYMSLKPQTFKYNEDTMNETYIGLLAQDVEESINNNNLANEKLSLVKGTDEEMYTLAYQELIPLNIKMIQKHEHDIQDLKDKVAKFRETANKLKNNSEI